MKRVFDIVLSTIGLTVFCVPILTGFVVCSWLTTSNGLFFQKRVGQHGQLFTIIKLKTMHPITQKIHPLQALLRKYKIDELPQFFIVLIGKMSIVGPRPDILGYYDQLEGENRKILMLKPGLTSEASLVFFDEEILLSQQSNPKIFNDTIIFPEKVQMNLHYAKQHSIGLDCIIIVKTIHFILKKICKKSVIR